MIPMELAWQNYLVATTPRFGDGCNLRIATDSVQIRLTVLELSAVQYSHPKMANWHYSRVV